MAEHRQIVAAVVQMNSTPDVAANLAAVDRLTAEAAAGGAELVALPEAFAFIGPDRDKRKLVEPLPEGGAILAHCQALARKHNCHLILGGFHEQSSDPGKSYNTCVHLQPDGKVVTCYRKIHLFDVDLADGTRLMESDRTLPGDTAKVTPTPFGPLGLSVCYDLRFPELYRRLVDQGATCLTVPSAFTASTGRDHWHVLLRARAIEFQCYLLAPAQWGQHHRSRTSYGHAMIVDPWGRIVAECSAEGDGVGIATLDVDVLAEVRRSLPSLTHRRLQ
jgi:predicted amidohydrolase